MIELIAKHWTGKLGVVAAVLGAGLAVTVAIQVSLSRIGPALWPWFWIALALAVTTWQVVGLFRTADRSLRGGSVQTATMIYVVMAIIMLMSLNAMVGLALGPAPEQASHKPGPVADLQVAGGRAEISGLITLDHFTALEHALGDGASVETILLDSEGGSIFAARGLARLIAENGIATHVSGACFSACTIAFIAGPERTMGQNASLGFHQYSMANASDTGAQFIDPKAEEARDIAYFRARGVAEDFLKQAFSIEPGDIWKPDRDRLLQAGILTR